MFCWEEVEEAGMEGHVRDVHKITGLQFEFEPTETTSQIIQTDEQKEQPLEDHDR